MTRTAVLVSIAVTLLGCKPGGPTLAAGDAEGSAEPMALAPDLDEVIATQGPLSVRASDVLEAAEWRVLLEGGVPAELLTPEWAAQTEQLGRLAGVVLDEKLLRFDADRWGLTVPGRAIDREIEALPALRRNLEGSGRPVVRTHLLDQAAVRRLVETQLLHTRWSDRRVADLTDEDLWEMWRAANDRATLEVVRIPNTHPRTAVEAFADQNEAAIRADYAARRAQLERPPRARVRVMRRFVQPAAADEREQAVQELGALRGRAEEQGFDEVAGTSDDPTAGLREGRWVSETQMPEVFASDSGALTPVIEDRSGAFFAEVLERQGASVRPLDETLHREIASRLLREQTVSPIAAARAERVLAAMRQQEVPLEETLREEGLRLQRTPSFRRMPNGSLPIVGQSQQLTDLAFADDAVVGEPFESVVHVGDDLVVARLADRRPPERDRFESERDVFRVRTITFVRDNGWTARVRDFASEHAREIDEARLSELIAAYLAAEAQ